MINEFLSARGIKNSDVQWILSFQFLFVLGCVFCLGLSGWRDSLPGFLTGALIMTFNLFTLAKILPHLIQQKNGSVPALLFSFYLRLIVVGVILYLAIVWANFSVTSLLAGVSTLLITSMVWTGRLVIRHKHKEV